jgi:hypothetical protein
MNGYFGALMRASGMPIAGRTPAVAPVESPMVEANVEVSQAPMPANTVATPSTPQQAVRPIHVHTAIAPAAPPAAGPADDSHEAATGFAAIEHADSRVAKTAADAVPASRTIEPAKPPLGQALVRAAMQWVATDTPQTRSVAQVEPPSEHPLAARGNETNIVASVPARRDHRAEPQAQLQEDAPAAAPVSDLSAREQVAPQAVAIHSIHPAPASPQMPVVPDDRHEVFEVSIGAIHVRVDAPVAQTVARPAATPPAAARRTLTSPSPRSGLSRRALRRI